jgi:hypothetical protein
MLLKIVGTARLPIHKWYMKLTYFTRYIKGLCRSKKFWEITDVIWVFSFPLKYTDLWFTFCYLLHFPDIWINYRQKIYHYDFSVCFHSCRLFQGRSLVGLTYFSDFMGGLTDPRNFSKSQACCFMITLKLQDFCFTLG